MKSLLFIIDSLGCGGAEKSLVSLLPLLNRNKYEIHLWVLHRGGGVFESLLPDNVILVDSPLYSRFETIKLRVAHFVYSLYFRALKLCNIREYGSETLWKCIGRVFKGLPQQFDVAIAYQQGTPTYVVTTKINANKKIAWINADIFKAGYNIKFNIQFYDLLDYIVPVSNELEMLLNKNLPQYSAKYRCVYDILNPYVIRNQAKQSIPEKSLFDNQVTIVTTGRLSYLKNHILAVESAHELSNMGVDFCWYFIGEGTERKAIEQKIAEYRLQNKVILLGLRTNPYPYMAACTVYVQTSIIEGFGLTIAEAKILGKPIVSTNFDVVYDQLTHRHNGLIAEMTPKSVAENIYLMLNDYELRSKIIDNVKKEQNTTYLTEARKVEEMIDGK